MKNIKKFAKKNLAIFLSFAIILSVLFPVLSGVVGLATAESAEQAAAISALKEAWGKMYKTETLLYPTVQKVSGTNTLADNLYATADGIVESLPAGISADDLGDYYAYHSKIFSTTGTGNNRIMWEKSTTSTAPDQNVYADYIDGFDDLKVSFYVEDVTGEENSFNIQFYNTKSQPYAISYTIKTEQKGKWVTLSASELVNGGVATIVSGLGNIKLGWLQFNFGDNKVKPKGWFGSLIGVINADVPELDGAALVKAAMDINVADYTNTDEFVAALNAAKALYEEELIIEELKSAWGKMQKVDTLMCPTIEKISGANTQSTVYNTADGIEGLPAGITANDLGANYAYHTGVFNSTGTAENRFMWSKDTSGTGVTTSNTDISQYDDLSVSFYVEEVATEGSFSIDLYTQGNTVDVANTTYNITAADEGKWITLRGDDMRVNGFDELISKMAEVNNGSYRLYFFQFGLGSNATKFKGYFGSLLGIKNAEVPELSGAALVKAAMDINVADYTNTDEFVAALNAAKALYEEELIIEELKSAWAGMHNSETLLVPAIQKVSGTNIMADGYYVTADGLVSALPTGITGEELGSYYSYHSGVKNTTGTAENRFIWSKNSNSTTMVYSGKSISDYDDIKLSFYIDDIVTEGSFEIELFSTTGKVAGKTMSATQADKGKWFVLDVKGLTGRNMEDLIASFGTTKGIGFIQFGLGSNKTKFSGWFGSLVGVKSAPTPDDSKTQSWSLADWVYEANKVDISGYENTEPFVKALANATQIRDELGSQKTCNTTSYPTASDAEGDASSLGENLLSGVDPAIYYYDGTEKTKCEIKLSSNICDGDFNTELALSDCVFTGEDSYVELIYNFTGSLNAKEFLVGFGGNNDLSNTNYKIYLADSIENLFLSDSIIASFYNENGEQVQKFNFDSKPDVSGSYLAFRFYGKENEHLTLSELGAYGEVRLYDIYAGDFTNEQVAALGDNILAHKETVSYVKTGNTGLVRTSGYVGIENDFSRITNGDVGTGIGISGAGSFLTQEGEEVSVFLVFDLGKAYNLDKILFSHATGNNLQTGKYELYASMDKTLITRNESRFISYDNMKSGPNGCTLTQVFTALGEGVAARYIGYRVTVPVCDYEAIKQYGGLTYPRFYELGVYGTEYMKPMKEINFISHVPVDVYRTDAGGNRTTIGEAEYSGDDYKLAYDGDLYTTIDTPIAQNGKYIDYIFNLCVAKNINTIRLTTATDNIKHFKVYAAETVEEIWNETSCVLDYNGENTNQVSRSFAETPIKARYVRFRILETESGAFDPTEFEVIGWNTQEFSYTNLMMDNHSNVSVITENKNDFSLKFCSEDKNEYIPGWMSKSQYGMEYGFDGDENTVTDLYGGNLGDKDGKGKETINLLFDLGNLMAIDSIEFIAGSSKDYWPSELKFYFGETDAELFGKDAKPVKTFTEKSNTENGSYAYNFLPELAQYVRIEIVESSHEYFSKHNYLVSIIADIKVDGLEVVGFSNSEGVAASVTDTETGIRVDVLGLRDNDIFTKLQDVLVVKRETTAEEKKALASKGAVYASDMYNVFLLDANGDIIEDIEGRSVRLCLPKSLFNGTGDVYVVANVWGEYQMVEHTTIDDYYCVEFDDPFGISAAFCEFANITEEDDNIIDTDNEDEDFFFEDDEDFSEDEEDDDEDEYETIIQKIKRPKKNANGFNYLWVIIAAGSTVVVIAAALIIFLILKKKKKEDGEVQ